MWRRLLIDNAALLVQFAANALVPLLLVPHFVRTLGVEHYGVLAMLVAAMGFAAVVVQYAFHLTGPAELAALASGRGERRLFLDIVAARLVLLAAVLVVFVPAGFAADALLAPAQPAWREAAALLAIPVGAALNAGWYLQARGRFAALALLSVGAVAVALAIGLTAVVSGSAQARFAAALALGAAPLLLGLGSLVCAALLLPSEPGRPTPASVLGALQRGRAAFLSQFVAALYSLAGPLVVGAVSGIRAAGLFSAIERPAAAVQAALTLTHTAAYPRASAFFAAGAREDYLRLLRQILVVYAVAVATLGLALLLLGDRVAQFLFGAAAADSGALLWLAYAWVALGIFGPMVTGYLTVRGTPNDILRLTAVVLLVSLPAGAAGAAMLGAAGWLMASIAGQLIVAAYAIRAWRHASGRPDQAARKG